MILAQGKSTKFIQTLLPRQAAKKQEVIFFLFSDAQHGANAEIKKQNVSILHFYYSKCEGVYIKS